jgi:hypothetical protein
MRPKHDLVTVKCVHCSTPMYRTDGWSVRSIEQDEITVRPVCITVNNVRMAFCGKTCAARWIMEQPAGSLLGGYPLF